MKMTYSQFMNLPEEGRRLVYYLSVFCEEALVAQTLMNIPHFFKLFEADILKFESWQETARRRAALYMGMPLNQWEQSIHAYMREKTRNIGVSGNVIYETLVQYFEEQDPFVPGIPLPLEIEE